MSVVIDRVVIIAGLCLMASSVRAAGVPDDCTQLIVALAPDWNSMHGRAQLLERAGGNWKTEGKLFPVLFGKSGLAWGSGLAGQDESGLRKKGARRARAGGNFSHRKNLYI